jgi:hypothetical protein
MVRRMAIDSDGWVGVAKQMMLVESEGRSIFLVLDGYMVSGTARRIHL